MPSSRPTRQPSPLLPQPGWCPPEGAPPSGGRGARRKAARERQEYIRSRIPCSIHTAWCVLLQRQECRTDAHVLMHRLLNRRLQLDKGGRGIDQIKTTRFPTHCMVCTTAQTGTGRSSLHLLAYLHSGNHVAGVRLAHRPGLCVHAERPWRVRCVSRGDIEHKGVRAGQRGVKQRRTRGEFPVEHVPDRHTAKARSTFEEEFIAYPAMRGYVYGWLQPTPG